MDREAYIGVCEDAKIGISLIFHLQNTLEYLREKELGQGKVSYSSVTLSDDLGIRSNTCSYEKWKIVFSPEMLIYVQIAKERELLTIR